MPPTLVLCYIPVLPIVERIEDPCRLFAYDQDADAPYVRTVSLSDLFLGARGEYAGIVGLVLDSIIVHPFALYAHRSDAEAKLRERFYDER